ncbi:MAG TPA: 3-hydroxyacyl-CoA dehydrogenase NAD-binding domain-containing protein [Burkholderiales bacterium]
MTTTTATTARQQASSTKPITSALIRGYGLMGKAVAGIFKAAGLEVTVQSGRAAQLSQPGVKFVAELPDSAPDLFLELVPEDLETKRAVFREAEAKWGDAPFLLGTGTSGLDLNDLAKGLRRPERLVAIHFYMPAEQIPIVEIGAGPATPRESVDRVAALLERAGKLPLKLYKPVVGFIANRLQHAILHEAYWMITEGICSAEEVDLAAARMLGPRMCASGLILQKDISGLKVNRDAQRAIVPHLFHNNQPNRLPGELFGKGESGLMAGKGFYDWAGLDPAQVRKVAAEELRKLIAFLDRETFPNSEKVQPKPRDLG